MTTSIIMRFIESNPCHPLAATVKKFNLIKTQGRKLKNGMQYFNYSTISGDFVMELLQ
jgi:hypothetical protein